MKILTSKIKQLFNKTKVGSKISRHKGDFNTSVAIYRELRGNKKEDNKEEKKTIKFEKKLYNTKFKEFVKILKDNDYAINKKSIILTVGDYSDNKRKIFEHSGFSNLYMNANNQEIFENDYVHWTVMPEAVNFDISKDILFSDSNFDKNGLKYILKSIKDIKENSKISSIILRVNFNLFFNDYQHDELDKKEKLNSIFNIYYRILNYINGQFEFSVPVYILLTEVEELYGFSSFLKIFSLEEKQQIFGISNLNDFDQEYSKNYSKTLTNEFKKILNSSLSEKILENLENEKFKDIVLFVKNLFNVVDKLNEFIDYLFLNRSINEGFLYRGFYLCGYEVGETLLFPVGIEKYRSLIDKNIDTELLKKHQESFEDLVFFRELYISKISKDFMFNLPTIQLIRRNRIHTMLSLSLLSASVLITPILFYNFYKRVKISSDNLNYTFSNLSAHINDKVDIKKSNLDMSKVNLTDLMDIFSAINKKKESKLSTWYSPLSLLSEFDNDISKFLDRMLIAFEVEPVRKMLEEKLKSSSSVNKNEKSEKSVDESYKDLIDFINLLTSLENYIKEYNLYSTELNVDKLNILLQKLLDVDLSDFFTKNNIVVKDIGKKYKFNKIDFINLKQNFTDKFKKLFNEMLHAIESERIIHDSSMKVISYIDDSSSDVEKNNYYNFLIQLKINLETLAKKIDFYSSSEQIITANGNEIKLDKLSYIIKNSFLLDGNSMSNFMLRIKESVVKRNQNILDYNSAILGPVFSKPDDKSGIKLSKNFLDLKTLLFDLNESDFFKPFKEQNFSKDIIFNSNLFDWNNVDFDYLAKHIDSYYKYSNEKIVAFPDTVKPFVKGAVLLGENQLLIKNMNKKKDDINKIKFANIEKEILNFNKNKDVIIKILKFFSENDLYNMSDELKRLTIEKIDSYFKYLQQKLTKEVHYEPVKGNFEWWDGDSPAAYSAYGVYDKRELTDYISTQNQQVEAIMSQFVQPLLEITTAAGMGVSIQGNSNYVFWKQMNNELLSNEKESGYHSLNNYILTNLTTETIDNCMDNVSIKDLGRTDFFSLKRKEISSLFNKKCKNLYENQVAIEYNKIVNLFNENLAGKFPFTNDYNMAKSEEVDEVTLKDFLTQFDDFINNDETIDYISSSKSEKWKNSMDFINKMKNVSLFMKKLYADDKNPTNNVLNLLVDFNKYKTSESNTVGLLERSIEVSGHEVSNFSQEKTITWSPVNDVSFAFRWANDYEQIPTLNDSVQTDKYTVDLNGKKVSFNAKNKWSLFYLIRKHAAGKSNFFYSQNLVFKIPVKSTKIIHKNERNVQTNTANVVIKVKFIDSKNQAAMQLPVFPDQAETLRISSL